MSGCDREFTGLHPSILSGSGWPSVSARTNPFRTGPRSVTFPSISFSLHGQVVQRSQDPLLGESQDALQREFVQTGDISCTVKRLVREPLCMFHQVPDLAWNGLIILHFQVRVLPGPTNRTASNLGGSADRERRGERNGSCSRHLDRFSDTAPDVPERHPVFSRPGTTGFFPSSASSVVGLALIAGDCTEKHRSESCCTGLYRFLPP